MYIIDHLEPFISFQLAVEMNLQSLLQYKQLAELQEARLEREREKIAMEFELRVITQLVGELAWNMDFIIIRIRCASDFCILSILSY